MTTTVLLSFVSVHCSISVGPSDVTTSFVLSTQRSPGLPLFLVVDISHEVHACARMNNVTKEATENIGLIICHLPTPFTRKFPVLRFFADCSHRSGRALR